jgi:phosphoribosylformylglycinamidine (FGAM) synthase-like amidotransferase family enzyme
MAGIDGEGNIYVNDAGSVRKVTPDGMVTTIPALPAALGRAPDGFRYKADQSGWRVTRVNADGSETTVAGAAEVPGTVLGALPGGLNAPRAIVPAGPYSFAIAAGNAILKLVLPH